MAGYLFPIFIFFSLSTASADCKIELLNIVDSAEHLINTSTLDPRCKKLGLMGGIQHCSKASVGTIWDLKALIEPVFNRAKRLCNQPLCAQNRNLCIGLLASERHLLAVGIYGLVEDIENAPWRASRSSPQ